jgi:hypothetical protein
MKVVKLSFSQYDIDQIQEALTFNKEEQIFEWEFDKVKIKIFAEIL